MWHENANVVEKPVRNDARELSLSDEVKQKAWAKHYEKLLNAEFHWDPSQLPEVPPLEGVPVTVTTNMVKVTGSIMKSGKAAGPSGVVSC